MSGCRLQPSRSGQTNAAVQYRNNAPCTKYDEKSSTSRYSGCNTRNDATMPAPKAATTSSRKRSWCGVGLFAGVGVSSIISSFSFRMGWGSSSATRELVQVELPRFEDVDVFISRSFPRFISFQSVNENRTLPELYHSGEAVKLSQRGEPYFVKGERVNESVTKINTTTFQNETIDSCRPRPWQEAMFPTCNLAHEVDQTDFLNEQFSYLTSGGYSNVFKMKDGVDQIHIFKKLKGKTSQFRQSGFDIARMDALVMERLTKSPYVMQMFIFCGDAAAVPLGSNESLDSFARRRRFSLSPKKKLHLGAQLAMSVADAHGIDGDEEPSILHGDLAAKQFILVNGLYKLNDFNRGRFIKRNEKQKLCALPARDHACSIRSPEELKKESPTSKIDVWALGSVLYLVLTGRNPWYRDDEYEARRRVVDGKKPPLSRTMIRKRRIKHDPIEDVLIQAIYNMCYVYDPKARATAREVSDFLNKEAEMFGLNVHEKIDFNSNI